MQTCAQCGEENPERAKFCLNCGASLAPATEGSREVRKVVTLLFTDVSGSTAIGELLDPESLRQIMGRYFDLMRGVIDRHGGTVEKFVGDAVMAVFGIPTLHEDDALRAVRAAIEMRDALRELNKELERDRGVTLEVRTGVNTGEVVAGDLSMGEAFVTGDPVNVASRLEQSAPVGEILLGPQTYGLVKNAVEVEPVEPLTLKGKAEPLPAYRLLSVAKDAPGFARRLDSRLVGRDAELKLLTQAFDRAIRERSCHLFTILGSAGVGKSRVVAEFLGEAIERANVVRGRCLSYGDGITYWALAEIVRNALELSEAATAAEVQEKLNALLGAQRDFERLINLLLQMMGLGGGTAAVEEIGWAMRRLLETLASEKPLVAVIDDIHWAEPALLDLIEYIADLSRQSPILLLCIARPELLDARAGWGGGKMNATSLLLEPLTESEADELVDGLLGRADLPRDARSAIADAAEGNPLFVEQMIEMLIDEGALVNSGSGWRATSSIEKIAVPPTIHALISARLDRLQDDERQVIERAAVIGKTFYAGALKHLSEESQADVGGHLTTLVRKELVRPDRESFGDEDTFRFRHILIRDTAYDSISKELRADLHLRFADWLENRVGERLPSFEEILAYHLGTAFGYKKDLGGNFDDLQAIGKKAAVHYEASAMRAIERGDYIAATKLLRAGLNLEAESDHRARMTLRLSDALITRGEMREALDALDDIETGNDELMNARVEIMRALALLGLDLAKGAEVAMEVTDRSIPHFEHIDDREWLARSWFLRMHGYNAMARSAEMIEAAQKAIGYAVEAGDLHIELEARGWLLSAHAHGRTPADAALELVRKERELDLESATLNAFLLIAEGHMEALRGNVAQGREIVGRAHGPLREMGLDYVAAMSGMVVADVEMIGGDYARAEEILTRSCEELEGYGDKGYLSTHLAMLAEVQCELGKYDEAELTAFHSKEVTSVDDHVSRAGWRGALARVRAHQSRLDEAIELADEAERIIGATDFLEFHGDLLVQRSQVLAIVGRLEEAVRSLEAAREIYERKGATAQIEKVERMLAELT